MEAKEAFVKKPLFHKRLITFRNLLILVIATFLVLTILAKNYDYFNLDLTLTLFIQEFHQSWFDFLMRAISQGGTVVVGTVVIVLISALLVYHKHFKTALTLLVSSYGVMVLGMILKDLIARPRPKANLIHQIGLYPKSDSFPSGHVLFAVGLYGFLFFLVATKLRSRLLLKKILLVILCLPLTLMGLSRIYLGAHWFSDVLGAYLVGYVWLFLMIHLYHSPKVFK